MPFRATGVRAVFDQRSLFAPAQVLLRTTDYIASQPLRANGRGMVGSIRVRLSGALIYWKLSPALFRAIFLAIVQILIVGSVAMAAAWIVFRRDYRISQRV